MLFRSRGGFTVDLEWTGGSLDAVTVHSALGGNCRIRSYVPLTGEGLTQSAGPNPNPLFAVPTVDEPVIHAAGFAPDFRAPQVYEYDLLTEVGDSVRIAAARRR